MTRPRPSTKKTINVSEPVWARLIERQGYARARAGRMVTLSEILEQLLDHADASDIIDQHRETL